MENFRLRCGINLNLLCGMENEKISQKTVMRLTFAEDIAQGMAQFAKTNPGFNVRVYLRGQEGNARNLEFHIRNVPRSTAGKLAIHFALQYGLQSKNNQ